MDTLPDELLRRILRDLLPRPLRIALRCVCRRWLRALPRSSLVEADRPLPKAPPTVCEIFWQRSTAQEKAGPVSRLILFSAWQGYVGLLEWGVTSFFRDGSVRNRLDAAAVEWPTAAAAGVAPPPDPSTAFDPDWTVSAAAAWGRSRPILEWLRARGCADEARVARGTAWVGDWSALDDALERTEDVAVAIRLAAKHGDSKILDALAQRYSGRWHAYVHRRDLAAYYGHKEVLRGHSVDSMGFSRGDHLDEHVWMAAAERGHLDILKWANSYGLPYCLPSSSSELKGICFRLAAAHGHVSVLEFLRPLCIMSEHIGHIFLYVHWSGRVDVLEWALTRTDFKPEDHLRTLWPLVVRRYAAAGNLECLRWLRAGGYPLDLDHRVFFSDRDKEGGTLPLVFYRAATHGHVHVLDWVESAGLWAAWVDRCQPKFDTAFDARFSAVIKKVASRGHIGVLEWLAARGLFADRPAQLDCERAQAHIPRAFMVQRGAVEWTVARQSGKGVKGGRVSLPPAQLEDAATAAASGGQPAVLEWLHRRVPGPYTEIRRGSGSLVRASSGHPVAGYLPLASLAAGDRACLEWVKSHGYPPAVHRVRPRRANVIRLAEVYGLASPVDGPAELSPTAGEVRAWLDGGPYPCGLTP